MGVRVVLLIGLLGACRMGFDDLPAAELGRDCGIAHDLGTPGALAPSTARVYRETVMSGSITQLSAPIDAELTLRVQLWDGYGAFAGGRARTGNFMIEGADASAATCGVCAYVTRRFSDSNTTTLLAISGEVTITQLGMTGATDAAAVSQLELAELDTTSSTLIPNGCHAVLGDASLQAASSSSSEGLSRGGHAGDGAGTGGDNN